MAVPSLQFVEGGRAPLPLGDGERIVDQLKFTRDALGGTWVEALDGASALHNGKPLLGRARLADGDRLEVGATRLRYALPDDDWSAVGEPSEATMSVPRQRPALPSPPSPSLPLPPAPPSAQPLPSLADDFDSPQTRQMSLEEVKRLIPEPSKPIAVAQVSDGPEALPPPPATKSQTGPGLVLPPPLRVTAKSRLAQSMLPDPDFGERVAPSPSALPSGGRLLKGGSGVGEVSEVSGGSQVSQVETAPGVLDPSFEITTNVTGELSEVTAPRDSAPVPRPIPRLNVHEEPIEAPTQPLLRAIDAPAPEDALVCACKFVRALAGSRTARGVLLVDLAWALPLGALLGWVSTRTGGAWPLAVLGGVLLLAVATLIAGARVAPKVAGVTMASLRGQPTAGLTADLIAVGRLRALVAGPLALVAIGLLLSGPHTVAGAGGSLAVIAAGLAFDAWLRSAYTACLCAWTRACERANSFDVRLAPPPLARALER